MFNSKAQFDGHPLEDRESNLEKIRNKALSMLDPQTQAAIRACDQTREKNHRMCFDAGGGVETGSSSENQSSPQLNQQQSNTDNLGSGVNNYLSSTEQNNSTPGTTPPQNLAQGTQGSTQLPTNILPKY